jgi:CO/xanthine dehydrogenase FAD-binding subunit
MEAFQYQVPTSLPEVLEILREKGQRAKVLAGGTDLLVLMKERKIQPGLVVDIGNLDQLQGIRIEQEHVWIGPLSTHWQLAQSELIRQHGQVLAQGASLVGSPQIRHRGTIGGNIANASPAADTAPPLVVLQAEVQISSSESSRWLPVESLMVGPSQTVLSSHELITAVRFPLQGKGFRSRYEKFGSRRALSIAVASVAVAAVQGKDGRLAEVRIALGSVSPTVIRATRVEEMLEGQILEAGLMAQAFESVGEACCPIDDVRGTIWYRRQLVGVLLARILNHWLRDD